jgi:ADP-ribose pyrophosphatase YjhB (NUDIX family)
MDLYFFCPRCGQKLGNQTQSQLQKQVCLACGFNIYHNPKPTVIALIEQDKKVLMIRQLIEPFKGDWDLPGGFVENTETLEQAVIREVKEETGLRVIETEYFCSATTPYQNAVDKQNLINLGVSFKVKVKGETKPGDDAGEICWFDWGNLPDNIARFDDAFLAINKRREELGL